MTGAPTLWVFAGELETPKRARALVRGWCAEARLLEPVVERLVLAANELVTNAVRHAGGGVVLSLVVESDVVMVEVSDRDAGDLRRPERTPSLATGGRGLLIVEALARSWGVRAAGTARRCGPASLCDPGVGAHRVGASSRARGCGRGMRTARVDAVYTPCCSTWR